MSEATTTMERKELVWRAIEFRRLNRVPIVFWNCDQTEGDVILYHLSLGAPGEGSVNAWYWSVNEWGPPSRVRQNIVVAPTVWRGLK